MPQPRASETPSSRPYRSDTGPSEHGLSEAEALARLHKYGPNEVARERQVSPWHLLLGQFKSPLIALLVVACTVSITPGDVLLLEAGDVVAADGRILEAHSMLTNEAALTGESLPVRKTPERSDSSAPLAERHGSVFMGTSVGNGTGRALVTATGMATEI